MGKLTSPRSPPTSARAPTFPRMDPPPPYEAGSSPSSSAHSNDRLQGGLGESSRDQASQQDNAQPEQRGPQPEQHSESQSDTAKARPYKTEEGCCTFGDGAQGCMVYGNRAEGMIAREPSMFESQHPNDYPKDFVLTSAHFQVV
ncbi:uncharacterized protein A1O9_02401 [Exophiala aquamarina CBS 119918]|uniref:Uncharacterized protein n=1 Tax=Exophiala aquamarina CBS 119918 TaxID=1182545 RepID=A0A072PL90_9EURO|nr:uncharacterized protein A1O9_02401 [Exophiala aquamarina CBS 119918]KEF60839.1 hypothetical protein A1O9_02401 [Exophiala aquamarina CBS 119918]